MQRRVKGKISKENPLGEGFGGEWEPVHILFRRTISADCSRKHQTGRRHLAGREIGPGTQP